MQGGITEGKVLAANLRISAVVCVNLRASLNPSEDFATLKSAYGGWLAAFVALHFYTYCLTRSAFYERQRTT